MAETACFLQHSGYRLYQQVTETKDKLGGFVNAVSRETFGYSQFLDLRPECVLEKMILWRGLYMQADTHKTHTQLTTDSKILT